MTASVIPTNLKSRFRGCILGAIVGDCMAARFGRSVEPFAAVSSRLEPASLRSQVPRSSGRFLFPYGVDTLMLLVAGRVVSDVSRSGAALPDGKYVGIESALLSELKETLGREAERASSIKWGVGTRHVLENATSVADAQLRSNCGITRALVAGLIDPEGGLAEGLCGATHSHESAKAGAREIARAVRIGIEQSRAIEGSDMGSCTYKKTVSRAVDLAVSRRYEEEEEFSTDLQERFKGRFGSDASSQCSVAASVFAIHRTAHSLPCLDASSSEYQARINEMTHASVSRQKKGLSMNSLGNSNRLDSSLLFSSLAPSVEQDLPVALAVSWAISLGGDVRSNACLAGGLAGSIYGAEGIPQEWLMFSEGVEEGGKLAETLYEIYSNKKNK